MWASGGVWGVIVSGPKGPWRGPGLGTAGLLLSLPRAPPPPLRRGPCQLPPPGLPGGSPVVPFALGYTCSWLSPWAGLSAAAPPCWGGLGLETMDPLVFLPRRPPLPLRQSLCQVPFPGMPGGSAQCRLPCAPLWDHLIPSRSPRLASGGLGYCCLPRASLKGHLLPSCLFWPLPRS